MQHSGGGFCLFDSREYPTLSAVIVGDGGGELRTSWTVGWGLVPSRTGQVGVSCGRGRVSRTADEVVLGAPLIDGSGISGSLAVVFEHRLREVGPICCRVVRDLPLVIGSRRGGWKGGWVKSSAGGHVGCVRHRGLVVGRASDTLTPVCPE